MQIHTMNIRRSSTLAEASTQGESFGLKNLHQINPWAAACAKLGNVASLLVDYNAIGLVMCLSLRWACRNGKLANSQTIQANPQCP